MSLQDILAGLLTAPPQFGANPSEPPATDAMASAAPMPAPDMGVPGGGVTAPPSGGMASALGLDPNRLALISRSLAGGLGKVKSGTTAGESIAQALGGSFAGGNTYEDEEQKRRLAEKTQADLNAYRQGTLGISQQNADSIEAQRISQADSGKYTPLNINGVDAEGKPVLKTVKFDSKTGNVSPFEEGTLAGKPGGGGASKKSVFEQRLEAASQVYGPGTKQALDVASGIKSMNRSDAMKFGLSQAETELARDLPLQRSLKNEKDRAAWKDRRGGEIADSVLAMPSLPGNITPQPGPAAAVPGMMVPGTGGKPLDIPVPARPRTVPPGSSYSPSRGQWRDPAGTLYDQTGAPI